MSIRDEVLKVLAESKTCMFPEEIQGRMPHVKIGTVRCTCFDLVEAGLVKVMRKDRPGQRIAAVFYLLPEQIAGVPGLMPYEPVVRKAKAAAGPDVLLTLPIDGDQKVKSVTVTYDCAAKLYATLSKVFGKAG